MGFIFQVHCGGNIDPSLGDMTQGPNQIPAVVFFLQNPFVGVLAFSHWYLVQASLK